MLYIDDREPQTKIQRLRETLGDHNVAVARTEVADYYLKDLSLGVERKSASDYISSFCSGKLFAQATELARIFKYPYVMVEGSLRELIYAKKGLHISSLYGSIGSLEAHYNTHVLFTAKYNYGTKEDYFVEVLAKLVNKYADGRTGSYSPIRQIQRPTPTIEDQKLNVLCSLPGIQETRARRLLAYFGSVRCILDASKEELMQVEGIGDELATSILEVIK